MMMVMGRAILITNAEDSRMVRGMSGTIKHQTMPVVGIMLDKNSSSTCVHPCSPKYTCIHIKPKEL